MSAIRRMMMKKSDVLPSGYTKLYYIEKVAAGRGVIEIPLVDNVYNTMNFRAEFDFMPFSFPVNDSYCCMLGSNSNFQAAYSKNGTAYIGNKGTADVFFTIGEKAHITAELIYNISGGKYYVNGVDTGLARSFRVGTIYIFAATAVSHYASSGRLYNLKIYDQNNNALVFNFIPCTNPNGYYGIYDLINKQFYYDANDQNGFTGG